MRVLRVLFLLMLLAVTAGCGQGAEQRSSSAAAADDDTIVLAAYRQLAPGENDGYYCSKILGVWEPLITADEETGALRRVSQHRGRCSMRGASGCFTCVRGCVFMMERH